MAIATIIDCGIGNLFSLKVALERERFAVHICSCVDRESDVVVLPGVGSFGEASRKMPRADLGEWVDRGRPLLGICLGLQLLFGRSAEGRGKGLAILPGSVERLPSTVKIPHIGWNRVYPRSEAGLLEGLGEAPWAYFVHSFYPKTEGSWVTAVTKYGTEFCSAVEWKNVWGLQFHPEKSGPAGRTIMKNFARLVRK